MRGLPLMKIAVLIGALLCAVPGQVAAAENAPVSGATDVADAHAQFVRRTCVRCHRDRTMTGGLTLEQFDFSNPEGEPEIAEKMIRKLRTGMMPPPPMKRPEQSDVDQLVAYLEGRLDAVAEANPAPGERTFQRLNRAEYQRSIGDLVALPVDVEALLPPDTISQGFDNIADVQTLSPTVMESYLRAAGKISRAAIGDPEGGAGEISYKVPRTASQMGHVEGAPWGTRGGLSTLHTFPATGEYVFRILLHSTPTGQLFGSTAAGEQLELSVDGHRVALLDVDPSMDESDPEGMEMKSARVTIKAGTRRLSAAFLAQYEGPVNDALQQIAHTLADTQIGNAQGVTTAPHLRNLAVTGPFNATGLAETPSRQRIFSCRPTSAREEMPCAERIVERLATQAYRRPLDNEDLGSLMGFFEVGASEGGFEQGIQTALQAILASPHFVFRLERVPDPVDSSRDAGDLEQAIIYELEDLDLASRLSFFLWGRGPDQELLRVASAGELSGEILSEQVDRMLAHPGAEALATRFASQWLRLQDLDRLHPDALAYPMYDHRLAEAMKKETLTFFEHIVREDKSVLDLLDADYTFVNARLAKHYGIKGVSGSEFRRVALTDPNRRGLLGQGAILASTSHANRTSPVLRGKWVMEVLLGSPPPPPPPDIPELDEGTTTAEGRPLTVRERLEEHRANPACASCHNMIDPIGLSLENFDVTGAWRTRDEGSPINALGTLYDGSDLQGPGDLREALLQRSDVFVTVFTEALLSYATGRRVDHADMPAVRAIVRKAESAGYRISAFIEATVDSPAFKLRALSAPAMSASREAVSDEVAN